jgi:hypothetical protein
MKVFGFMKVMETVFNVLQLTYANLTPLKEDGYISGTVMIL